MTAAAGRDFRECILRDRPPESQWRAIPVAGSEMSRAEAEELCTRHGVRLLDEYSGQLGELARVRWPGGDEAAARAAFLEERANGGVWMFFGWSNRLVRVLDRDDFFEVITSRNRDKITRDEQDRLRAASIGVVGLSVGGEIAVTLAQEHLCGRIKVADFDELELSNLNRLGSGVGDLGVNKAWLVARRIAEIDPWLAVEVYDGGVCEENALAFMDGLDLLVDECDDLRMKFRLREIAREQRINLVYAADERGMLSVEPYGNLDLPVFHGMVTGPHPPREAFATSADFFRALTDWLGGWDRISDRSRRSLLQVGKELAGYPQLAGEPRLAAGQVAHVARRFLLGERLPPFFGYVDLDAMVPGASG